MAKNPFYLFFAIFEPFLKLVILNVLSHIVQVCHVQIMLYLTLEGYLLDTQEICFKVFFAHYLGVISCSVMMVSLPFSLIGLI